MLGEFASHKRQPVVAGSFYPSDSTILRDNIASMLHDAQHIDTAKPKVLIAPHAGYIYSGPIAATAYRCLEDYKGQYKTVVLMGPSHRVALRGLALSSDQIFSTPLGDIPVAQQINEKLLSLNGTSILDQAHLYEHSLEVHLPFLQSVLTDFELVPIVVGDCPPELVSQALDILNNDSTLIVISSDLSHYHAYTTAQQIDNRTTENILALNFDHIDGHMACGCNPLNGALLWAKQHDLHIQLLDLRNSGDTAGDKERVVGYGAYVIT